MNKKIFLRIFEILVSIVFLMNFSGCVNTSKKTISGSIEIPENGIIQTEIFEQLKSENSIAIFKGNSNNIEYEWTVFGSDISEPKDLNFGVVFNEVSDNSISFELLSEQDFGFTSTLSVYLDNYWNVQSASVYLKTDDNLTPVCSASITGSKSSILNFSLSQTYGSYMIIADENIENVENDIIYTDETSEISEKNNSDNYLSEVSEGETENFNENSENYSDADLKVEDSYSDEIQVEVENDNRVYSDGTQTEQDKYQTDPVPEGKPMPVEPDEVTVNEDKVMTCTFSIECTTILNNISELNEEKLDVLPSNGIIFETATVEFNEGESVFDVLQRVCQENNIHMEASWTPIYNSAYVEGINNLYEFDCGNLSGWMYRVNGWYPNYGCSRYQLAEGDVVEWRFTCDLGKDVGCEWLSGT